MQLLTSHNSLILWRDVVKFAENRSSIVLNEDLEAYLVSLLIRYTNKPEVAQQIFASSFLQAMQKGQNQRNTALRDVGDGCLLVAGLFPHTADKKHVKISYFVDLGRSSYAAISLAANDLFYSLALQFVAMIDVLQSIRENVSMLPLEAYEQWTEIGSQRALQILQQYSEGFPFKIIK